MRRASTTRSVLWLLALTLIGSALRAAAVGELAAPPLTSLGDLGDWVDGRTPAAAALALVRGAAELGAWYLLALSVLHIAATVVQRRGSHRVVEVLALPGASRLVRAGLGLGLAASSALVDPGAPNQLGSATVAAADPGTAVMRPIAGQRDAAGVATMTPITARPEGGGTESSGPGGGTATMRPTRSTARGDGAPPATATPWPSTWTVTVDESLWSIAAELLADRTGHRPFDHIIDPFWRELVEVNRHRLVDPGNPDLIVPGQVLEVPPAPKAEA